MFARRAMAFGGCASRAAAGRAAGKAVRSGLRKISSSNGGLKPKFLAAGTLLGGAAIGGGLWTVTSDKSHVLSFPLFPVAEENKSNDVSDAKQESTIDANRLISLEEFRSDHNGRIWLAWEGGVYDMTGFMDSHPGGPARIAMVEGQDLGKYWKVYGLHHRKHIKELMKKFKIGSLSPEDFKTVSDETVFDSPYKSDPTRTFHPNSRIASKAPWNIEPPLEELSKNFFTPNELFFVRNHNPVPDIDIDSWKLTVESCPDLGITGTTSFSFEEIINKLPKHDVVATLQCAGNRQRDFIEDDRPLYVAPSWQNGAIGTARWTGVRVRDVLQACGVDVDAMALGKKSPGNARIVNFIAEDLDETGIQYASVLPIERVLDPWADVILAYEMNGERLSRDHGFPIRLLAPGTAGCRNAKWISSITVTAQPTDLDSGSTLDRHFSPAVSFEDHRQHCVEHSPSNGGNASGGHAKAGECRLNPRSDVEFGNGPVIQNMPVTSAFTSPRAGSEVHADDSGAVAVQGYAFAGGGRGVVRVEVSTDGGQTFQAASLQDPPTGVQLTANGIPSPAPELGVGRNWAWRLFRDRVPLPPEARAQLARGQPARVRLCSKAVDGDFNSQPERMQHTWNTLGICANHYDCIDVTVRPAATPASPMEPQHHGGGTNDSCGSRGSSSSNAAGSGGSVEAANIVAAAKAKPAENSERRA